MIHVVCMYRQPGLYVWSLLLFLFLGGNQLYVYDPTMKTKVKQNTTTIETQITSSILKL